MTDERSDVQAAHRELLEEVERQAERLQRYAEQIPVVLSTSVMSRHLREAADTLSSLATALRESLARVEAAEKTQEELIQAMDEWRVSAFKALERAQAAEERERELREALATAYEIANTSEIPFDDAHPLVAQTIHAQNAARSEIRDILRPVLLAHEDAALNPAGSTEVEGDAP